MEIRSIVVLTGGVEILVNENAESLTRHIQRDVEWVSLVEVVCLDKVAPVYVRCDSIIAIKQYAPASIDPSPTSYAGDGWWS